MAATLSTNFLGRALKVSNKTATAARPALPARAPVVTKALFTSKKAAPKKVRFSFLRVLFLSFSPSRLTSQGATFSSRNRHSGARLYTLHA